MVNQKPQVVEEYLAAGCGRCPLGGTPDCKVHTWTQELKALRHILQQTALVEEIKWSVPCYTIDGANVLLLTALKHYAAIDFFKGSLLKDPAGILYQPTANSQAGRLLRFTHVEQVTAQAATITAYVEEAIEIEQAGLKVTYKDTAAYDFPDELLSKFEDDPAFAAAFEALTPGRQRGYLLHFSSAKQSATRARRIEKAMPRIFEGKGFHDR